MNRRIYDAAIAVVLTAVLLLSGYEAGTYIEKALAAGPPLSTAVSISDPSNNGNQASVDNFGSLHFVPTGTGGTSAGVSATGSDSVSSQASLATLGYNYVFNGTNWDRLRGTANAGMSVAPYGVNMVPVFNSSGVQANAAAVATLAGAVGKTTYLVGYFCTDNGETTATAATITITGLNGGTYTDLNSGVATAPGTRTQNNASFIPPLPASAPNTAIVVTKPALGAGNTFALCQAWGFQL